MRLTRLRCLNFMGYEELDLDLSTTGLAVVVGENGSGKSSLLDAITWALYDEVGRPVSSQDLLIRDGADSTTVSVEFTAGGKAVEVTREKQRGRTGALTLTVDGKSATRHTLAETKVAIEALVGLPYTALMAGPVMAQETAGAFMKARPADRKDLLVKLFGLDRFEGYHKAANEKRIAAQSKAEHAASDVESLDRRMGDEAAHRLRLLDANAALGTANEAQSLAHDRLGTAKEKLAAGRTRAEQAARLRGRREDLSRRLAANDAEKANLAARLKTAKVLSERPLSPFDPAALAEAEAALERAQEATNQKTRLKAQLDVAEATVAQMEGVRAKLANVPCGGEGIYATCQFLTSVPSPDAVEQARQSATTIAGEIEHLPPADYTSRRAAVDLLRGNLNLRRAAEVDAASAIATLDEGERSLSALIDAGRAMEADLDQVREEVAEAEGALSDVTEWQAEAAAADAMYAEARRLAALAETDIRTHTAAIAVIEQNREQRAEAVKMQARAEAATAAYRLLAEAFHRDGIPTRILMGGIPLIEAEANRVLATLPGDMSVAFRTQRAKATGGMADTLDVIVTVNGWDREYGLLSVGQRFRVDLAIRLGLARVLTHRTGGSIETLWLDEPLAALDVHGREAVMETLSILAADFGLIVVVSHHSEVNDQFEARVEVKQEDGVSTARLVA